MRRFFLNLNCGTNFSFLSFSHIIITIITFLIIILIYSNREKIVKFNTHKMIVYRLLAGIIILITIILRRGSFIYYGVYNWKYHLDIGFCNFTSILFILYCLTGNIKLNRLLYCCAFCGPLSAILFPSINIGMNNYSFFVFVLIHNIVFILTFLFSIYYQLDYCRNAQKKVIGILLVYFISIYIFNIIFGTNYNSFGTLLNDKLYLITFFKNISVNKLYDLLLIIYGFFMVGVSSLLLKKTNR